MTLSVQCFDMQLGSKYTLFYAILCLLIPTPIDTSIDSTVHCLLSMI